MMDQDVIVNAAQTGVLQNMLSDKGDRSSSTEDFETPSSYFTNKREAVIEGEDNNTYREKLMRIVLNEFTTKELKRLGRISVRMLDYTTPFLLHAEEVTSNIIKNIKADEMIICDHIKIDLTGLLDKEDLKELPSHILIPVLLPGEYLGGEMVRVREFVASNKNAIILMLTQKLKIMIDYKNEELNFENKSLDEIKRLCRDSLRLSHELLNSKVDHLNAFVTGNTTRLYNHILSQYSTMKEKVEGIDLNVYKSELIVNKESYYHNMKSYYVQTLDYFGFNMFKQAKEGILHLSYQIVDATTEVMKSFSGSLFNMDAKMRMEFLNKHINNAINLFKRVLTSTQNVVSRNEELMNINLSWIKSGIQSMYKKLIETQEYLRDKYYINQE